MFDPLRRRSLLAGMAALAAVFVAGCASELLAPANSESALVIGRIEINYGPKSGMAPFTDGVVKEGILVELEMQGRRELVSVTTDAEGYFFLPNLPRATYDLRRVSSGSVTPYVRGGYSVSLQRYGIDSGTLVFTPAPGKVGYAGGVVVDVDDRGFSSVREAPDEAAARDYFFKNWGKSAWALREMISLRPKPATRQNFHF
jgi:hypothetical protein